MNTKKNLFKCSMLLAACISLTTMAMGQDKTTLSIGDPAPEMKYAKWIKGTPVQQFEKDKLYVLEFWATWCGPCKAAMPHLTELAKKYRDEATFIGVNILEKTGDQPYESSLPAVTRFVNSIGEKMGYNVVADNNEHYMANKWMLAAGETGIPSTFLVQKGKVIWIGHPIKLDSIMESVIAGKYDMEAFKKKFAESKAKRAASTGKYNVVLEPIQKALTAKEYEKALTLIDIEIDKRPEMVFLLSNLKLSALLDQQKEDKALEFAKKWIKSNENMATTVAQVILAKEGLSKQAYLYTVELLKHSLTMKGVIIPFIHHAIATAYEKAGDIKSAIAAEKKAILTAKAALKEGKLLGSILDYTVTDFEAQLAIYKSKL